MKKIDIKDIPNAVQVFALIVLLQFVFLVSVNISLGANHAQTLPFWAILALVVLNIFYFVPALVGSFKHHRQAPAIWGVNIFLGWTGIGWVVALIWAISNDAPPEVVIKGPVSPAQAVPLATLTYDQGEEQITRLIALKYKGLITEAELNTKKAEILAKLT